MLFFLKRAGNVITAMLQNEKMRGIVITALYFFEKVLGIVFFGYFQNIKKVW